MLRVLLLLLFVMSSIAFAQTPDEKPQASKFDEFTTATNGYVKMIMDGCFVELDNNPSVRGYIVNYGTEKEIAVREKQIRNSIVFRKFDATRITIIKGGFRGKVKTDLWLVPVGAEHPKLEPTASKFDEFGQTTPGDIKARIDALFAELKKKKDLQGYIFNYGTARQIAVREKLIRNMIPFRRYDATRITIVNGGKGIGLKTILWIVPEGAEVPKP